MTKIALVDLDGVLNDYTGQYNEREIPSIKAGAKEFLEKLSKYYDIELFTVRNKIRTVEWLKENKIDHLIKEVSNVKNQFASLIIDDRALSFTGNYKSTLEKAIRFKPYWKE